jgi:diguanylate cyclase (GGDEF)-like protein
MKAIKRHVTGGKLLAVILLDLDRFKVVNDSLGHEAGDRVLLETAERLASICGEGHTVARLGGDEFALILENLDGTDRVAHFCDNLIECLTRVIDIADYEITVSPSMGIAIYPTDAEDADTLVKKADTAMNRAKELGRNRYTFVTEELDNRARARLDVEVGLQKALSKDEFLIHYQPRVEASSGKILGAEALLRWQRPGVGIVSPVDFIPILEETALIIPVGERVLEEACRQCKHWHAQGHDNLCVSVNVSVCQFESPTFLSSLKAVLEETGLPPQALELEFTESVFMGDIGEAVKFMNAVKATGVKLAIDDFGTGYSSLSYLTNLPLDYLKIDRAFVADVTANKDHASIAQAIAVMAKSLDMKIIGEGVETRTQQDYLVELRCDELQGFYFSRPVEAAQFMALLGNEPWVK